ncbi:GNAT family N-acetyltransferase, partial [bacterium]
AVDGEELVGFVLGNAEQWDRARHFNLREMCVAIDRQRSGLGTNLMNALQSGLIEQGIDRIYLLTARDTSAQSFYEKCGFYVSPKMVMMVKWGIAESSE